MSLTYRMKRTGGSVHLEQLQHACLDEMSWPSGRTLRTSDPGGMWTLYGPCKTGSLGALVGRGGYRFRRYRRLWPRRGRLRLLASDEGSAGSFPGLSIEVTRACFHTVGKRFVRKIALKIWTRRDTVRCGRCFKALFGIPFGPGALLTLRPLMAS